MGKLDKIAVADEIEKCYNECLKRAKICDADFWSGKADGYRNVLAILDTIEMEEADRQCKQSEWKPSDEQLKELKALLEWEIGVYNKKKWDVIWSLYEDLQKL